MVDVVGRAGPCLGVSLQVERSCRARAMFSSLQGKGKAGWRNMQGLVGQECYVENMLKNVFRW